MTVFYKWDGEARGQGFVKKTCGPQAFAWKPDPSTWPRALSKVVGVSEWPAPQKNLFLTPGI